MTYANNARALLAASAAGSNPYVGYTATPPVNGVSFDPETPRGLTSMLASEAAGLAALPSLAFVLVAGGLGERLGFPGIKLALPVETLTGQCYLDFYAQHIL